MTSIEPRNSKDHRNRWLFLGAFSPIVVSVLFVVFNSASAPDTSLDLFVSQPTDEIQAKLPPEHDDVVEKPSREPERPRPQIPDQAGGDDERVQVAEDTLFSYDTKVPVDDRKQLQALAMWEARRLWGGRNQDTYYGAPSTIYDTSVLRPQEPLFVSTLPAELYYGPAYTDTVWSYYIVVLDNDESEQFVQFLPVVRTETPDGVVVVDTTHAEFGESNPVTRASVRFPSLTADEARTLVATQLGVEPRDVGNAKLVNIPYPVVDYPQALYQFGPTPAIKEAVFVRLYDGRFFSSRLDYESAMHDYYWLPWEFGTTEDDLNLLGNRTPLHQ